MNYEPLIEELRKPQYVGTSDQQAAKTDQCEKDRLELFRCQVRQETEIATFKLEVQEIKDRGVA